MAVVVAMAEVQPKRINASVKSFISISREEDDGPTVQ